MTKRAIYWAIMCTFMAIITIICGMTIVHSSKVATLTLDQTVTYNPPTNIQVTFDAGEGVFTDHDNAHTFDTTIKINTLSGTSIFPTDPTRTGYTFGGYEYSVDGTNYRDYASASDMPFTDHLYARAKWEEVTGYEVTIKFPYVKYGDECDVLQVWDDWDENIITGNGWHSETNPARGNELKDGNRNFTTEMQATPNKGSMADIHIITYTGRVLVLLRDCGILDWFFCSVNTGGDSLLKGSGRVSGYTGVAFTIGGSSNHEITFTDITWCD